MTRPAAVVVAAPLVDAKQRGDAKIAELEKAGCPDSETTRCQVVTLFGGGQYKLYTYRKYSDVRLAWAPEDRAATFGGDPDNFNFPRYSLDASFLRAYEKGRPVATPEHLKWNPRAPEEGEITFVVGNPGSTSRLWTDSQLAFERQATANLRLRDVAAQTRKLKELIERGEADVEDGALAEAERAFTAALKLRDQRRCGTDVSNGSKNKNPYPNRCRGDLLRMRAIARLDRLGYGRDDDAADDDDDDFDPEGDLEECVAIDPGDHAAWRVLADVSRERGDCEEAFLRLSRAQAAAPNSAKIAQEVFAAARAARDQIRGGKGTYEGRRVPSGVDARVDSFYKILGVTASATAKQIRRGYRKAAAVWHPDKWQSGGGAALATAEKEFRRVSAAYEVLGNPSQRRAYDSDPARFEAKVAN